MLQFDFDKDLRKRLKEFLDLGEGWDSYGAPPPNELSIQLSKTILDILIDMEKYPGDMIPHVEGGVSIMFFRELDWLYIETYNDGDVVISDLARKDVLCELKHPVSEEDLKIIEELIDDRTRSV